VPYGDKSLALSIGNRVRGLSRKCLFAFAEDIGLRSSVGTKILYELLDQLSGLEDEIRGGARALEIDPDNGWARGIPERVRAQD